MSGWWYQKWCGIIHNCFCQCPNCQTCVYAGMPEADWWVVVWCLCVLLCWLPQCWCCPQMVNLLWFYFLLCYPTIHVSLCPLPSVFYSFFVYVYLCLYFISFSTKYHESVGLHFDACAYSQLQAGGHPRYSAGDVAVHDDLQYVSEYFQQRPAQVELLCDMRNTSGRHWKKCVHGLIKIFFY